MGKKLNKSNLPWVQLRLVKQVRGLADFFYFARSDAARTHMHANMRAMGTYCFNILQIRP
jgi:hypothetical protein